MTEEIKCRIDYESIAPEAVKAQLGLETYVRRSGPDRPLLELVRLRASEINGCAYCVDMHTKDARAAGESTGETLYWGDHRGEKFCGVRRRALGVQQ
jgi:AhpD family alkylhydroperoxidase